MQTQLTVQRLHNVANNIKKKRYLRVAHVLCVLVRMVAPYLRKGWGCRPIGLAGPRGLQN
jgi:hypothetical protein